MINKINYIEFLYGISKHKINPNHIISIKKWKNTYQKYMFVEITTINSHLEFTFGYDHTDANDEKRAEKECDEFLKLFE